MFKEIDKYISKHGTSHNIKGRLGERGHMLPIVAHAGAHCPTEGAFRFLGREGEEILKDLSIEIFFFILKNIFFKTNTFQNFKI